MAKVLLNGNVSVNQGSITPTGGLWATRSNMPTERSSLGLVTASNGKIYAIGGSDSNSALFTNEEYDPATDTWHTKTSLPFPGRYGLGVAATSNGKVYAIGGYNDYLSTVEEYDLASDSWTSRTNMPTERYDLSAVTANNGKIYAIGGYHGPGGSCLSTVEEYNPITDTWTTRANLPITNVAPCKLPVTIASDGKIYAILGGNTLVEYILDMDIWITRATMNITAEGMAASNNGKIYVIGVDASVKEYDPITHIIVTKSSIPTMRSGPGIVTANNGRIYVIGGYNNGYLNTVEEFTPPTISTGYWISHSTIQGNLSLPESSQVESSNISGSITAGSGSKVEETVVSGSIIVNGGGLIKNNTVTNNVISIGSGQVLSNTIIGGGISAGTGSIVQDNNIENAPGWGISTNSSAIITHNRVVGNASGINASDGSVQNNLIANNTGVGLQVSGNASITNNTLIGNGGKAIVVSSGTPIINNNNFEFNTGQYDLYNDTANAIDASNNWWGTTDNVTIGTRIFDYWDGDFTKGQVAFTPPNTDPDQTAPSYVRSVTVLPDTTLGIQTGTFDVEFSRPMDVNSTPQMSFKRSAATWVTRANMPTARDLLGVAAANNGKIYAIGGGGGPILATVEVYDPATNTWATRASMPTARSYLVI